MLVSRLARRAVALLFVLVVGALAAPPLQALPGQVRGRVLDPDGNGVPGARVTLGNEVTGREQRATSGADGGYTFFNVPENPYHLSASLAGFRPAHVDLEVRGGIPVRQDLVLALAVSTSTTVSAQKEAVALETDTATTHVDLDKSLIRRAPAAVASRAFEALITSAPGFGQDENGRYHFQGGHSQQLLVIDGQPIGDQVGITFASSLDPAIAESVEVVTGGIQAEYGEKANGVINLTTRSGLGLGGVQGDAGLGAARFSTYEGSAAVGGGDSRLGWFVNLAASRSDRFLDPVSFDNLHNTGETQRAFLRLDSVSTGGTDLLRLTGSLGRTTRDVTNLPSQQEIGQDQTVLSNDVNVSLGYQRVLSSETVLDAQVYARDNRLTLYSSPVDTPVRADQSRSLANQGVSLSISTRSSVHELKSGVQLKRFPIEERFTFAITDPTFNDPASDLYNPNLAPFDLTRGGSYFRFEGSRSGTYAAAFVQDTIRLSDLTIQAGLRYDHNRLFQGESQLQPRLGLAYHVEATHTVLRASYNRMLLTPEYENILLSSSDAAAALAPPALRESRELGGGRLFNVSERHDAYNVGLQQALGSKLRLDLSWWYRDVTNAADQSQLFNTGIVFPLNFAGARLDGWNARLDVAPVGGLRAYVSLGHVRARYVNPFVGGLFLDAAAADSLASAGESFVIDHDQDLQEQAGLFYDLGATGFWAGVTQRYDSGLVTDAGNAADVLGSPDTAYAAPFLRFDEDPQRVTSRTVWSFSLGARLTRYGLPLELQLDVLNAFDARGLYNFQSVFGGTHVIPPRTLAGRIKLIF